MQPLVSPDSSSLVLCQSLNSDPQNVSQNPSESESQRTSSGSFQVVQELKSSSKKREVKVKTPLKEQSQNEVIMRLSGTKQVNEMISPKEVLESLKKACKSSLKKKAENEENQDKENNQPKDCQKSGVKLLPLAEEMTEVQVVVEINETNNVPIEEKTQDVKEIVGKEVKENKENVDAGGSKERNEGKGRSKTPAKLEEKKSLELSTNKSSVKSIGKVALFYHKCGICNKNMITGKEKTRLLSCTHRFHEECIASKANRCFLCDGLEAYDSRPSERSLKKTLF